MIYVPQLVAQYATAIVASVPQDAYQDAINAIVPLAYAAQVFAIILAAAYAFALLANAILEEDAILHVITCATTVVNRNLYYIILFFWIIKLNTLIIF